MRKFILAAFASCLLVSTPAFAEADVEPALTPGELTAVLSSGLAKEIEKPSTLAFSSDDVVFWANKAKAVHANAPVVHGDKTKLYDIVIQIGHYPRTTGKTGGQGKYVNEQQMAALVAVGLQQKLNAMKVNEKPISAILVGADDYERGLQSRIFLSLHTDSSSTPCTVGPSVGYQKISDAQGMHGIALALAITLGLDAEKFMKDNYTRNLAGYYAYSQFDTKDFKGLLEMSELSCPKQEGELLTRAALLSANLALAVQWALR